MQPTGGLDPNDWHWKLAAAVVVAIEVKSKQNRKQKNTRQPQADDKSNSMKATVVDRERKREVIQLSERYHTFN